MQRRPPTPHYICIKKPWNEPSTLTACIKILPYSSARKTRKRDALSGGRWRAKGFSYYSTQKHSGLTFYVSENALLFAISASPSLPNFCGISEIPGITKMQVLEIRIVPFPRGTRALTERTASFVWITLTLFLQISIFSNLSIPSI